MTEAGGPQMTSSAVVATSPTGQWLLGAQSFRMRTSDNTGISRPTGAGAARGRSFLTAAEWEEWVSWGRQVFPYSTTGDA